MTFLILAMIAVIAVVIIKTVNENKYKELETEVLEELGFSTLNMFSYYDENIIVKSRQALENYDDIKYFKENKEKLEYAKKVIKRKDKIINILKDFLDNNEYSSRSQYKKLSAKINAVIKIAEGRHGACYRIHIAYISRAGNNLGERLMELYEHDIAKFESDPSLLMGKGEYNKYLKEQKQEALAEKQHEYYEYVNKIIDHANDNRDTLFIKGSLERLDSSISQLFDKTVNSIKKIKSIDSEEWDIIKALIVRTENDINNIIEKNHKILKYYDSSEFLKIKETCELLMNTQREFNEYIIEKVEAISHLFGTRVVRNETVDNDEYQYIRPYKKTITPFTAEVSAAVFASAENSPLEYVIKNFYPDKKKYPEQIQKLHLLLEELATLKEAKNIIDNYKKEYQQYLGDVPMYVIEDDESGFYSRLGFANIDENVLTVEYKFSYTSGGGMAKRTFTVPMTEETIIELIRSLEGKLTASAFSKEQRSLMTNKLREHIKKRDNFTCRNCGNSVYLEPNLLLEIDHIMPVSKGGCTVEENLQTLCWKCNRAKSNKLIDIQ